MELFWNLINDYHNILVNAINNVTQKRNLSDLGLCVSRIEDTVYKGNWSYYHIKFKEETEWLKQKFADCVWTEFQIDDDGNIIKEERDKRPDNYQDYACHLERELYWSLCKLLKKELRVWLKRFCECDFTNIDEIIYLIAGIKNREFSSIPLYCEDDRKPNLITLWRSLDRDISMINYTKKFGTFMGYFMMIICVINNSTVKEVSCDRSY